MKDYCKIAKRVRLLVRTLGTKAAVGHARNQGISFETAYWLIFNRNPRIL